MTTDCTHPALSSTGDFYTSWDIGFGTFIDARVSMATTQSGRGPLSLVTCNIMGRSSNNLDSDSGVVARKLAHNNRLRMVIASQFSSFTWYTKISMGCRCARSRDAIGKPIGFGILLVLLSACCVNGGDEIDSLVGKKQRILSFLSQGVIPMIDVQTALTEEKINQGFPGALTVMDDLGIAQIANESYDI